MNKLSDKKILIVDDEVDLCRILRWDFEDVGAKVIVAHGAYEAINLINEHDIDIIVSDIKMPQGDGVELLDYVKKAKKDYDAFIFMSGYSDYPKDDLLAKGAFIVIDKPINFESLKNKLEKLLA